MELTDQQRIDIILASVNAVNAESKTDDNVPFEAKVAMKASTITAMVDPRSNISKVVQGVAKAKAFTGIVLGIRKEQSSTRGIVTLKTGTTAEHKGCDPGTEEARTDRTDNPVGKAMANHIRTLVGHRIAIRIEVEEYDAPNVSGGKGKVRVIRHVEDLGVSDDVDAQQALARKQAAAKG